VSIVDEAAAQLTDELGGRAAALAALGGGLDVIEMERWAAGVARPVAAQLAQEADDRLAAQACVDVMCALWPETGPPPEWWQTPVGRLCARSAGADDEVVTHAVAAAMLGVQRGTVGSLVAQGRLDRHPDGGVLLASVYQRLAR
jgi:hypothetical protein